MAQRGIEELTQPPQRATVVIPLIGCFEAELLLCNDRLAKVQVHVVVRLGYRAVSAPAWWGRHLMVSSVITSMQTSRLPERTTDWQQYWQSSSHLKQNSTSRSEMPTEPPSPMFDIGTTTISITSVFCSPVEALQTSAAEASTASRCRELG
jgi:hypothetical protein